MFLSADLDELISPPWSPSREGRRHARLRAFLTSFVDGAFITVANNPFDKDARAILARVDPPEAEVWDFRCLDPNPGMRVFGSFAEKDTFVALTWDYRENVDDWHEKVVECRDEWKKLFGDLLPLIGKTPNDYLSYNFRSVSPKGS